MSKIKDVVSWFMLDEKMLKLKKANTTFILEDKVVEFIKKNKLDEKEEFAVEVEVVEASKEGEDSTITSLKEIDSTKEPEPVKEGNANTETNSDNIKKELTVHGVSVAKKGVKFKEEDVWYTLSDDIDAQAFKDDCTGQTVEVAIEKAEKGNDVIVNFTVKESDKKDKDKEVDEPKKKYNNASKSIEAQASLKCAKVIVASMVNKDSDPNFVLKLITRISEHAYQTLQDLKNKE